MRNTLLKLYVKAQIMRDALNNESGQDLIEYALVVSLIAFAAIAGMNVLATDINTAFGNIGAKLASTA
jgi:pilus assembly protein Flp/PilA